MVPSLNPLAISSTFIFTLLEVSANDLFVSKQNPPKPISTVNHKAINYFFMIIICFFVIF